MDLAERASYETTSYQVAPTPALLDRVQSLAPGDTDGFTVVFDDSLLAEQITSALDALCDYFRACGGAGFRIESNLQEIRVREPVNA